MVPDRERLDVEGATQRRDEVDAASALGELLRQLRMGREVRAAIHHVKDRLAVLPVEIDVDRPGGVADDVTDELSEDELGRGEIRGLLRLLAEALEELRARRAR